MFSLTFYLLNVKYFSRELNGCRDVCWFPLDWSNTPQPTQPVGSYSSLYFILLCEMPICGSSRNNNLIGKLGFFSVFTSFERDARWEG